MESVDIVKSSSAYRVEFTKLDSNTNLNKPPRNYSYLSIGPESNTVLHTTSFGGTQEQCTNFLTAHVVCKLRLKS